MAEAAETAVPSQRKMSLWTMQKENDASICVSGDGAARMLRKRTRQMLSKKKTMCPEAAKNRLVVSFL